MIAIIGAGLSGLSAALELTKKKQKFLLLDSANEVGGKLKTINWSNFNLDIGFQVLLSAYPSLAQIISADEFTSLNPYYFESGALILKEGKIYTLSDPMQNPKDFLKTLFCPLITLKDKLKIILLKNELKEYSYDEIWQKTSWQAQSTLEFLQTKGFSEKFIDNFAKPFWGGVFGNNSLLQNANCFVFCFKAFSEGKVFIPAKGIQELPKILQKKIPLEMLKLNSEVSSIQAENHKFKIILQDKKYYIVDSIILATELEKTNTLLNLPNENFEYDLREKYHNLYFVSKVSLYSGKKIFLNANPQAIINNGVQISNLNSHNNQTEYLISTTVLKETCCPKACIQELEALFPQAKNQITFLKSFEISGANSLFKQNHENTKIRQSSIQNLKACLPSNIFLAGEYLSQNCSQENSIKTGFKAAQECLEKFTT